jgi:enamine deaminase RidA (YjgF/YER057c/UK114 family)
VSVLLDEVDRELDDIGKLTVYVVGERESLEGYERVYRETFSEPYPCQTVVGIRPLGGSEVILEMEAEVPLDGD